MAASMIVFLSMFRSRWGPTSRAENVNQRVPVRGRKVRGMLGLPGAMKEGNAHFPSGLAAIRSQKFGRRYPGCVLSRMSVFMVPNVVSGL